MDIKTKYDIGYKFYICTTTGREYKDITCPVCEGKGQLTTHNFTYNCPKCKGYDNGIMQAYKMHYDAVQYTVASIEININQDSMTIGYSCYPNKDKSKNYYLFYEEQIENISKQEALKQAKESNESEEWQTESW